MAKLILPKKLQKALEEQKKDEANKFVKDKIFEIAHQYYKKMPDVKELWILIAAKRDWITQKINVMIRAADRDNKHKIDIPIQGCQLWYTNQKTGEIKPEWILPLSARKQADNLERVSEGNNLIKSYIDKASKRIGRDILTGQIVK